MQVKLRSISKPARKMPAVGHGNAVIKTLVATRTNWITQVQVITIPSGTPQLQISDLPSKMVQLLGLAMPFSKMTQHSEAVRFLITKVPNGFASRFS